VVRSERWRVGGISLKSFLALRMIKAKDITDGRLTYVEGADPELDPG